MFTKLFTILSLSFALVSQGYQLPNVPSKTQDTSLPSTLTEELPGQIAPTGYFDPFNLSAGKSDATIKKWREAELKHGRVAMLAAAGILVQESFNPLFGGKVIGPGIYHFQQMHNVFPPFWYLALLGIGIVEGATISKGWGKMDSNGVAQLKEEYIPGDLGFDPLNLKPYGRYESYSNLSEEFKDIRTKELQNGRLAMLGIAGIVAQELVDKHTILEHFREFGFGFGVPR